jgi:orotidine-5'-phosphate decarboxylase
MDGGTWLTLKETIAYIHAEAPGVPVIWDAKRADIGKTNAGYVRAFERLGADAITVNPYFGAEAMKPFLEMKEKGIIVLCRTSNSGAEKVQNLRVHLLPEECQELFYSLHTNSFSAEIPNDPILLPFYKVMAHQVVNDWNYNGNCCVVVGATCPGELREVRKIVGDMPILIPGIGTQGGDLEQTVKAGMDSRGKGMIINSSSGIIFSPDPRRATLELHEASSQYRKEVVNAR